MPDIKEKIKDILSNESNQPAFEQMPEEELSPLNQPVTEKYFGGTGQHDRQETNPPTDTDSEPENAFHIPDEDLDAPEQKIDEDGFDPFEEKEETFELPTEHALQAADAMLGVTDNLLEVGGGYFVKIRKHKLFYDFDEIIQVIDQQNEKNVQRIKLEPEDKILLRPLLVAVIKKRAQKLTPEQQLLGAVISILFKKVQAVIEIRAENEFLVERILGIIKEENSKPEQEPLKEAATEPAETVEEAVVEVA